MCVGDRVGCADGATIGLCDGPGVGRPASYVGDNEGADVGRDVGRYVGKIVGLPAMYVGADDGAGDGAGDGKGDGFDVGEPAVNVRGRQSGLR